MRHGQGIPHIVERTKTLRCAFIQVWHRQYKCRDHHETECPGIKYGGPHSLGHVDLRIMGLLRSMTRGVKAGDRVHYIDQAEKEAKEDGWCVFGNDATASVASVIREGEKAGKLYRCRRISKQGNDKDD